MNSELYDLLEEAEKLYTEYDLVAGSLLAGNWINKVRKALSGFKPNEMIVFTEECKTKSDTISLRWRQTVINQDSAVKNITIAVQDIYWLLEENKRLQGSINELAELVDWLQKG